MNDYTKTKYFTYLVDNSEILEKEFDEFRSKIVSLMNSDTDELGQVLKSHLIIENFIDEYLSAAFPAITSWKSSRITFNQKLELINNPKTAVALFYKSIKELNSLRNKFSHELSYSIKGSDIKEIKEQITIWNNAAGKSIPTGLTLIDQYTLLICLTFHSTIKAIKRETPETGISGYLKWIENMMET